MQCMNATGTVFTLTARFSYSKWIIESPRCVSHSVHACTQAWQPMHRCGSMKKWSDSGFGIAVLLLRLEDAGIGRPAIRSPHPTAADLVLPDLANATLRGHRQPI